MATLILLCTVIFTALLTATTACTEGDLEQLPLDEEGFGFIRYCLTARWRLLCDNGNWNREAAIAACRQLGFGDQGRSGKARATDTQSGYFIQMYAPCNGEENSLRECGVWGVGRSCSNNRYGKLKCDPALCSDGETRLVGKSSAHKTQGRVEACLNGRWGTVQTSQPKAVTEAVCHSLSATLESINGRLQGYRQAKPVYSCSVSEPSNGILSCQTTNNGNHDMDLAIECLPLSSQDSSQESISCGQRNGELRLVNGATYSEGRVEVCMNGQWGAVCSSSQEGVAEAVCTQLGFPSEGSNITTLMMTDTERQTYKCGFNEKEDPNCMESICADSMDLRVKCLTHSEVTNMTTFCTRNQESYFRLVGGPSLNRGRVEVCANRQWRTVCIASQRIAASVCSQLGFSDENASLASTVEERAQRYCCYSDTSATPDCHPCDQSECNESTSIEVVCQTWEQVIEQRLSELPRIDTALKPSGEDKQRCSSGGTAAPLGAVIGVLFAVLITATIGWVCTCVALQRRGPSRSKESSMYRTENYSLQQLNDHESTPTQSDYSSVVDPNYDDIMTQNDGMSNYEVIQQHQQNAPAQATTPPKDKATSKSSDDFYNTEKHTYAVVSTAHKKKARKPPEVGEDEMGEPPEVGEDEMGEPPEVGEDEMGEPPVYEVALPGETSWGVRDGVEA